LYIKTLGNEQALRKLHNQRVRKIVAKIPGNRVKSRLASSGSPNEKGVGQSLREDLQIRYLTKSFLIWTESRASGQKGKGSPNASPNNKGNV
jgi:hypothetical protein